MRKRESGFVGFREKCGPVSVFLCRPAVPISEDAAVGAYKDDVIPLSISDRYGVERFIAREGKAGSPCLGGERGPSNDAESLGYRVARPSVFEEILFRDFRNVPYGARMVWRIGRPAACLFRGRPPRQKAGLAVGGSPDPVVSDERKERFPERFYFRNPSIPAPNSAKSYLTGSEASSVRSEAVISSTAFQSFCFRASSPSARPIWPVCTSSGR